jgi:hypothetical protein
MDSVGFSLFSSTFKVHLNPRRIGFDAKDPLICRNIVVSGDQTAGPLDFDCIEVRNITEAEVNDRFVTAFKTVASEPLMYPAFVTGLQTNLCANGIAF